jgi:hypothetical protein
VARLLQGGSRLEYDEKQCFTIVSYNIKSLENNYYKLLPYVYFLFFFKTMLYFFSISLKIKNKNQKKLFLFVSAGENDNTGGSKLN